MPECCTFSKLPSLILELIYCLIRVLFDPFPYPPRRLSSPSLFYFISTFETSRLTVCSSSSPSPSSISLPSSSVSEPVSFALSFQSQVPDSLSLSLVSVVLSWSSSILYWVELGSELASDFLFQLFGILKRGGSCGFLLFASSLGWHDDKAGAADTYLALITVWLGIEGWWNNESIRSIGDLLLCTH